MVDSLSTASEIIKITEDGQVTKRIIKEGVGLQTTDNSTVSVHYDGYIYETGTLFDSSYQRNTEFTFTLNSGKVIKAWELAIPTMKVGEKAEIICTSDFGYGDKGRQYIVPKKAKLRFEVELLGFWESAKSATERIASAEKKKMEGNELFKKQALDEALFAYRKGRDFIKDLWNCEAHDLEQARHLMVALHLNIGACYLKMKNYEHAIEVCKKALDRDPSNLKAHYRIAQAYLELGEFDNGIEFIRAGLQYKPMDTDMKAMLATLEKRKEQYLAESKKLYRKMCSN